MVLFISYAGMVAYLQANPTEWEKLDTALFAFGAAREVVFAPYHSDDNAFRRFYPLLEGPAALERFKKLIVRAESEGRVLYGMGNKKNPYDVINGLLVRHGYNPVILGEDRYTKIIIYPLLEQLMSTTNPNLKVVWREYSRQ